jgi:predicted dehydrogenase
VAGEFPAIGGRQWHQLASFTPPANLGDNNLNKEEMVMRQLSVGILGTGFMGGMHGQRLMKQEGVKLAGLCGETVAMAKALKEKLGAVEAALYDDFDEMLAKSKLDALYVCIPPFAHNGQVEKAAEHGITLFLEKPIAYGINRGESMVTAIERAGVVSQVGYHMRYRKSVEQVKEWIASGKAGRPTLFEGRYWCNMFGSAWWHAKKGSNGQVFEQVIHIYDMALYLLGEAESVSAFMDNLVHRSSHEYTIEDTSAAVIRFKNGSLATINGSNCALPVHFIGDYRAVFENVVLEHHAGGQDWVTPDTARLSVHEGEIIEQHDFIEDRDLYLAETGEFLQAVRGEGRTRAPARQGLEGLRLVSAVLESAEKGGALVRL